MCWIISIMLIAFDHSPASMCCSPRRCLLCSCLYARNTKSEKKNKFGESGRVERQESHYSFQLFMPFGWLCRNIFSAADARCCCLSPSSRARTHSERRSSLCKFHFFSSFSILFFEVARFFVSVCVHTENCTHYK
jgi:hypothetical protein